MNKRIRKKKEKYSLQEYSFEFDSKYLYKNRKKIVNELWKLCQKREIKISINYKRRDNYGI